MVTRCLIIQILEGIDSIMFSTFLSFFRSLLPYPEGLISEEFLEYSKIPADKQLIDDTVYELKRSTANCKTIVLSTGKQITLYV